MTNVDVAIVGGGPAGLTAALALARQGRSVALFEKRRWPVDKACGEGIMPAGVELLRGFGVRVEGHPFAGIRYRLADGSCSAEACFAEGPGLAVRRLDLSQALFEACRQQSHVELHAESPARLLSSSPQGVVLQVGERTWQARLLVGADGLHSAVRRWAGLGSERRGYWRWGVRQHYWVAPWSDKVEVTLGDGCEAYVTPVSASQVGVAMLFTRGKTADFGELLKHFPDLRERLAGAAPASEIRSLGPLEQKVRGVAAPGIVLLGDAGGYVDASTGEGISLALAQVEQLLRYLPANWGSRVELGWKYGWARANLTRAYKLTTYGSLLLSRFPLLRQGFVRFLRNRPRLFQILLSINMGKSPF